MKITVKPVFFLAQYIIPYMAEANSYIKDVNESLSTITYFLSSSSSADQGLLYSIAN